MGQHERECACGRHAAGVLRVASEDGLFLFPVCEECSDPVTGVAEEQLEVFGHLERRPLAAMPSHQDDQQPRLPLGELEEQHESGAAIASHRL